MTSETMYSFVTKRDERKSLELLKTTASTSSSSSDEKTTTKKKPPEGITLRVVKTSLTANNKFYLDFGDKPPFYFNKCYPIDGTRSKVLLGDNDGTTEKMGDDTEPQRYVHPPVWGIAEVTYSSLEAVPVGTQYLAQLPMGETVHFGGARIDDTDDRKLVVDRPATNPAYNVFNQWAKGKPHNDLAVACFPGICTGFGLDYRLRKRDCYGADAIVITSASSKVALALALYLKHHKNDDEHPKLTKKIIGYTSEANKEFCQKTGLYDEILGYEEALNASGPTTKYVIVDIAGRGSVYNRERVHPNVEIVKLLTVGNSSGTSDKESTFASFSITGTLKMVFTMMNWLPWLCSMLNPVEELYLIVNDMKEMTEENGIETNRALGRYYEDLFCEAASKWISVRNCDTEESIRNAFSDIVEGTVPPSETIILDVAKAVAHRK